MSTVDSNAHIPDAEAIIEKFGGIRPMATKVGVPVTTVQGWKKRNVIPANRVDQISAAADMHGVELGPLLRIVTGVDAMIDRAPAPAPTPANDVDDDHIDLTPISDPVVVEIPATQQQPKPAAAPTVAEVKPAPEAKVAPVKYNRRKTDKTAQATWIAVMILAVAVIIGLVTMGPGVERIVTQQKRLTAMETELQQINDQIGAVKSQNSLLMGLVPDNLRTQIDGLQERAKGIEATVSNIGMQARALTEGVMGPNAGTIEQRLSRVEDQITKFAAMTGSQQLSNFVGKLQQLQGSADGRMFLSTANTQLQSVLAQLSPTSTDKDVDKAIAEAAKKGPELNQTMDGLNTNEMKAAAMLLALTQFRQTLARGNQSFDEDLATMRNLVAKDNPELLAAIDQLAPKAKLGILTPQGLNQEFRAMTGDIVAASLAGKDVSITEKAQARLHEVLKVERNGQPLTGTTTQQAIDAAQTKLDRGDVQGAISTLQALDGAAAATAAPWVNKAETTILANQVQDMLTKTVSAKISVQPFVQQFAGTPNANNINLQALTNGLIRSLSNTGVPTAPTNMIPAPMMNIGPTHK